MNSSFHPRRIGSRLLLALLVLPGLVAISGAAAAGVVLHEGTFAADGITWQRAPGGGVVPVLAGGHQLAETGKPALPVVNLELLIDPELPVVDIEIVPLEVVRLKAPAPLGLALAQRTSRGVPVTWEGTEQAQEGVFPARWGRFGGVHTFRGYRLLGATLFPVRVVGDVDADHPVLEVMTRYRVVAITGDRVPAVDRMAVRRRFVPGERERTERLLRSVVANPEALPGYRRDDGQIVPEADTGFDPDKTPSLSGSAVSYLIVTSDELAPVFQSLADYHTAHGLPAVVVTVEWIRENYRQGVDLQETIRMFIREAYERWGIEYLLLGGDTDIIPARYAYSTFYPPGGHTDIPTDLYYSCLDGNWNADGDDLFGEPYLSVYTPGDDVDLASDVFCGRAPVSNVADAQAFVDKVIAYESAPAGSDWTNRFLFAAEVLFEDDEGVPTLDGADFAESIHDSLLVPAGVTTARLYESWAATDTLGVPLYPGAVPETRQAVIDSIDTGHYNIVDQIGHGYFYVMEVNDANFTVADADNLVNPHPFVMYALNCASAAFDYSCLMERMIQNHQGGSVVSIGASREAFPTTANSFQFEFFRQLYQEQNLRLGDTVVAGMLPWLAQANARSFERWTYFNYTVLGDPALRLWSTVPRAVAVTAPGTLDTGEQDVSVTVTAGGSPVPDALVTLAMTGSVYATGTTDAAGQVTIPVVLAAPGTLSVTVVGDNLEPAEGEITVVSPGTTLAVDAVTVVDDGTLGSQGNGDGRIDAGETVALLPTFRDTGGGGAVGVTAFLTCTAAGITVTDPNLVVGNVSPGGTATAQDPALVQVAADVPDGTLVTLRWVASDGADQWPSAWTATVVGPEVVPFALSWYDQYFGDGDGGLDAGERVAIQLWLKNYGAGTAGGLVARLRSDNPNVTIYDSVITYPDLATLQESSGMAMASLAVADTALDRSAWFVVTDAEGRTFRHDFEIRPPAQPEEPTANTSLGPTIIALSWTPVAGDVRGYNVYRSTSEGGPYQRANADLLEGIAYFADDGLATLSRYYYRIAAVDSSLVEGLWSQPISESTAPPEAGDFPLPLPVETSSHCAVGDVNGDHVLDIVIAADEIYVFDAGGNELFDGDHDSQTAGPITDLDGTFTPMGIALADLDGVPGDEIVCADRDARLMHVLRWDGTELPGWPQSTGNHWIWATPAIGDVDGDGEPEIVANNLGGQTLVWHVDGTELLDGDGDPSTNGPFYVRDVLPWAEWNRSSPALFDLDGDGAREIIFGTRYGWNAQNYLYALKADTTQPPGFPYATGGGGSIMCSPTVADLNGDGTWEIVFVSEDDTLHVLEPDGTHYPGFPIPFEAQSINGDVTCPSPAVGDFDDDGELEIVAVEIHGTAATTFTGLVYIIDTDIAGGTSGQALPGWPQYVPGNSESSPVVGDINGDGSLDIIFGIGGSNVETPNNLYAWNADGTYVEGFPMTLGGPIRPAPVICDLDGDRDVDIVYAGWDFLVHVWDMPYPVDGTKLPWPTFRGSNTRDGVFRHPSTTAVETPRPPAALTLRPAVPNPFNPVTRIELYVPGEGTAVPLEVGIFDVLGRRVRRLQAGVTTPGWHSWTWYGRDDAGRRLGSGVYFLRAVSGGDARTMKLTLVK